MKSVLLTSTTIIAFAGGAAVAADMPLKAVTYAPAYSWTGCYFGVNGGGAWNSTSYTIGNNNSGFFDPAFAAGAPGTTCLMIIFWSFTSNSTPIPVKTS